MSRYLYIPLFISALFLNSCAIQSSITKSGYDFSKIKRIAVLDFKDASGHPVSGTMASDIFVKYMLKAGYEVLERSQLDEILKEKNISSAGLLDKKNIQKLTGIDALIAGSVEAYIPETDIYDGSYPRFIAAQVGIGARMIDVQTGETLWSGSGSYDGMNTQIAAEYLIASIVREFQNDIKSTQGIKQ